jgi:maltooligosyltrehalose synthase
MPIGIDPEGRWVFVYLLTGLQQEDFQWFLQQHSVLLAVLPAWVIQVVCLPHTKGIADPPGALPFCAIAGANGAM